MNESSKKSAAWTAAAKRLIADKDERVVCPHCDDGYLEVTTVKWSDDSHVDIHMHCAACRTSNVTTVIRKA